MDEKNKFFISLLKKEVVPALGCTEPVAVALACAFAAKPLNKPVEALTVWVSKNIFKNGKGVMVPGTGEKGLRIAAAAGAVYGDPDLNMEVLKPATPALVLKAKDFSASPDLEVYCKSSVNNVYIEAQASSGGSVVRTVIKGRHDAVILIEKDGKTLFSAPVQDLAEACDNRFEYGLKDLWLFADTVAEQDIAFVLESADMNKKAALAGIESAHGLAVGKYTQIFQEQGIVGRDLIQEAVKWTCAAIDARMAGLNVPVMSNSGSGDQGITITMPILIVAEIKNKSRQELTRALALGHLVSIYVKAKTGRLTAMCGVAFAALAASCAIVRLFGGNFAQMGFCVKNLVGGISGMICDGAKGSCALKAGVSVFAAVQSALLAVADREIDEEGIVNKYAEKSIDNLGRIVQAMIPVDSVVVDIMRGK